MNNSWKRTANMRNYITYKQVLSRMVFNNSESLVDLYGFVPSVSEHKHITLTDFIITWFFAEFSSDTLGERIRIVAVSDKSFAEAFHLPLVEVVSYKYSTTW
jgi:hypothetical protein